MIMPDKMSQLSNNEFITSLYKELNNELTKNIIKRLKEYENLTDKSKIDIKKVIRLEKNKILKESLIKTRKLNRKTKKEINKVYKELRDALNDSRGHNKKS